MRCERVLRILLLAGWTLATLGCAAGARTLAPESAPDEGAFALTSKQRESALAIAAEARESRERGEFRVQGAVVTEEMVTSVARFPATDETDDRLLASVLSFDYQTGETFLVVVDVGGEKVVDARVVTGAAAPLAPREESRLRELLAKDSPAYRALFEMPEDAYDLGTFVSVGRDDLAGHRIVLVRPVPFRDIPSTPYAVVDLTTERVLRYEGDEKDREELPPEGPEGEVKP
ncbi:MAG: hypothetical protein AAF481_12680 [Acidobacteriota bacterium]